MSNSSSESISSSQGGKNYGLQRAETAALGSDLSAGKQKVLSAVSELIDALSARASSVPPPPAASANGTSGTSGTNGTVGGSTGLGNTATGVRPSTGQPSSEQPSSTGSSRANTGSTTSGNTGSTGNTGPASSATGNTGNTSIGAGSSSTSPEALEAASISAQREQFRIDRARETARKVTREAAPSVATSPTRAPSLLADKHQSDSNRAPLTESKAFGPSFGSKGRSATATLEKMARSPNRPESSQPVVINAGQPIDAYFASFGTAVDRAAARAKVRSTHLEAIIGRDDRTRVPDTTVYPYRCVCSLNITAQNGTSWIGTGWLVAPRLLLTAGHCVFMADQGGWASQIEVIPGRDANVRPYGSVIATDLRSVGGWTVDNDSNYDYGAILLPEDRRLGDELGWFGYAARTDSELRSSRLNVSGYPGDGGVAPGVPGTQWTMDREVRDVMEFQLTYEIDTYGGQSGAPVWEMASDGSRYGVGIHTYGTSVCNGATRIRREVFDNIILWAGQAP